MSPTPEDLATFLSRLKKYIFLRALWLVRRTIDSHQAFLAASLAIPASIEQARPQGNGMTFISIDVDANTEQGKTVTPIAGLSDWFRRPPMQAAAGRRLIKVP